MFQGSSTSIRREHYTKIILIVIFLGGFALFIGWTFVFGHWIDVFQLSVMDLALLGLSTYRLGRLVAYERVMEPFRKFFTETVPDSTGAGESVEPKGEGIRHALGQLICCPICTGTWIAAGLTYLYFLVPGPTRVFLIMTSAIAIAELLGALTEALSWSGQYARTMSGAKMLERAKSQEESRQAVDYPDANRNHQVDTVVETYRDYR
jgi:hypothetical protein